MALYGIFVASFEKIVFPPNTILCIQVNSKKFFKDVHIPWKKNNKDRKISSKKFRNVQLKKHQLKKSRIVNSNENLAPPSALSRIISTPPKKRHSPAIFPFLIFPRVFRANLWSLRWKKTFRRKVFEDDAHYMVSLFARRWATLALDWRVWGLREKRVAVAKVEGLGAGGGGGCRRRCNGGREIGSSAGGVYLYLARLAWRWMRLQRVLERRGWALSIPQRRLFVSPMGFARRIGFWRGFVGSLMKFGVKMKG